MTAFLPQSKIKSTASGGHRCQPAKFASGKPVKRREYARYFDDEGLEAMAQVGWI